MTLQETIKKHGFNKWITDGNSVIRITGITLTNHATVQFKNGGWDEINFNEKNNWELYVEPEPDVIDKILNLADVDIVRITATKDSTRIIVINKDGSSISTSDWKYNDALQKAWQHINNPV